MPDAVSQLASALADRYRLERELGQGGMATVYLAEDLKHGRKVAIKVLHPELSAVIGSERFLAEIRTTASLQHPHILGLIDSGAVGGLPEGSGSGADTRLLYYVMPFIEGEALRGRLNREKQLPVDDALRLAKEVASALEFAHKRGIVHRDIKPENILLQDGQALVADFGIALAVQQAGGSRMTQTGMSLGTPAYMSPEQAMGERELGPRSDVYALGAMTYEMLTGEPPFTGPNSQAIVARVLTEQPQPIRPRRATVTPGAEAAVMRALQKLPADRFGSARAFAEALDGKGGEVPTVAMPHARGPVRRGVPPAAMLTAAALALLAAAAAWFLRRPAAVPSARFLVSFPAGQEPVSEVHLTPDGSRLVYIGPAVPGGARDTIPVIGTPIAGSALRAVGATQVWVKDRNAFNAVPLPGATNVLALSVSSDSRQVAFVQQEKLMRMSLAGSAPVMVADSVFATGTAWLDDGSLIYTTTSFWLMRAPPGGGPPVQLWHARDPSRAPVISGTLPGSRGFFFSECVINCFPISNLWVYDFKAKQARELMPGIVSAVPLADGILGLLRQDGRLLASRFDPRSLALQGAAVPVLSDAGPVASSVETFLSSALPAFAVSATGDLIMRSRAVGTQRGVWDMVWIDRQGRVTPLDTTWSFELSRSSNNNGWAISPDGTRLAIGLSTVSGDDIWIKQLPYGPLSRLTFDSLSEQRPRWTPDGKHVTYTIDGVRRFGMRRADGTGTERQWSPVLPDVARDSLIGQVNEILTSPDGQWIIARIGGSQGLRGPRNLYAWRPAVDSISRPLLADPAYDESSAALSPDGRWIAYSSDETGRSEVYIRPFPDVDEGKWQVSNAGGQAPLWAHSGKELFFVNLERDLVAVPVRTSDGMSLGAPSTLFRLGNDIFLSYPEYYTPFTIAPDDSRFLMARDRRPGANDGASTFYLVQNWGAELEATLK